MTVLIAHALTVDRVWMVSIVTRAAARRDTLGTTVKKVKLMSNLAAIPSHHFWSITNNNDHTFRV